MIIPLEAVNEFVFEKFEKVKVSKNGTHFHARCALCGDSKISLSKKRFHLDYNNGQPIYHCFNCNRAGTFIELYSVINGLTISDALKHFSRFDSDNVKSLLSTKKIKRNGNGIEDKLEYFDPILEQCIGLNEKPKGVVESGYRQLLEKFAKERKIPKDYPIYIAVDGGYKGRVIIPIIEAGHIIYFQGRAVTPNMEPKYKNPILQKGNVILNKEKFERNKYIIITEGIIDALQIGNQGTCVLGASLSDNFVEKIMKFTDVGVIFAPDNDEPGLKELKRIFEEGKYVNRIKYFIMPYKYSKVKDLNQLCIEHNIEDVYEFIVENSHSAFDARVRLGIGRKK